MGDPRVITLQEGKGQRSFSIFHLRAWANVMWFLQTRGKVKRSPRWKAKPKGLKPRSAKESESQALKAH